MRSNLAIQNLARQFQKLPSVGPKTAQRFVYALLKDPAKENLRQLESALKQAQETVSICRNCFNISEGELCHICRDQSRSRKTICIVEDALDIIPIEDCDEFRGVYFVFGSGEISRLCESRQARSNELIARIKSDEAQEIIIASSPSAEGEAASLLLQKLIFENFGRGQIKITRLGRGLPTGGDIKYADGETMRGALRGRQNLD